LLKKALFFLVRFLKSKIEPAPKSQKIQFATKTTRH
jgi:hypothetical protein